MLIPLRPGELQRLIPAVATGTQFRVALGNPQEVLQRLMIAAIGGVITLLISQSQMASRWGPFWLVTGVVFLLYVLWGPILQAGQKNATLGVPMTVRTSRSRQLWLPGCHGCRTQAGGLKPAGNLLQTFQSCNITF